MPATPESRLSNEEFSKHQPGPASDDVTKEAAGKLFMDAGNIYMAAGDQHPDQQRAAENQMLVDIQTDMKAGRQYLGSR